MIFFRAFFGIALIATTKTGVDIVAAETLDWKNTSSSHLRQQQQHAPLRKAHKPAFCNKNHQDKNNENYISNGACFATLRTPIRLHLALANNSADTEMMISFETIAKTGTPVVLYGKKGSGDMSHKVDGISQTYAAQNMCGPPANITTTTTDAYGMFHHVHLQQLQPNTTYTYKAGLSYGQGVVWSPQYQFTTATTPKQLVGNETDDNFEPFRYIVFANHGSPSSGSHNASRWISDMVGQQVVANDDDDGDLRIPVRAVHIIGGLSFAKGRSVDMWNDWMDQNQVFTAYVPLMIAIGNTEYDYRYFNNNNNNSSDDLTISPNDPSVQKNETNNSYYFHPSWGNFGNNDSGGECGVPTAQRFIMPSSQSNTSNGVFWYSFDYSLVHTIVLSSEHNMTRGSRQYAFLQNDLENLLDRRDVTPWVVVEIHRPLYHSSDIDWDDNAVGLGERYEIEDLLHQYEVDLVLSGHYPSYLRTCEGLYRSKCNNGGPTHITIGSSGGGGELVNSSTYPQNWTERYLVQTYGFGQVTVANSTWLRFQFVQAGPEGDASTGAVLDDVWITRNNMGHQKSTPQFMVA